MENLTITAKIPAKAAVGDKPATPELGPCTVIVQNGATAKEQIELFGDEAVKTNADASWIVTVQSGIRAGLKRGEAPEQIQERLGSAKMGVASKGATVDPVQAYMAKFATMTPEEQKSEIAKLKERASKK